MLIVWNTVSSEDISNLSGSSSQLLILIRVTCGTCLNVHFWTPTLCVLVAQSCPILFDPMNYSPPSSSVHGSPRQEFLSGMPFPSPRDLPDPGIESRSPELQAGSLPSKLPGKLKNPIFWANSLSADVDGPRILHFGKWFCGKNML